MQTADSELTAGFWAAAERHELVRPVCRQCGKNFFTPQVACPRCLSENWRYEVSSGRGRVYSATTVYKPPSAEFTAPYGVGIVDLDEGWSMLANLVGDPLPGIGTRVSVTWIPRADLTVPAYTSAQ